MKKHIIIVIVAVLFFLSCCNISTASNPGELSVFKKNKNQVGKWYIDFRDVETIGNHSFIILDLDGSPKDNTSLILNVLNAFEKEKGVVVVGYEFEARSIENANNGWRDVVVSHHVDGVWVIHRPK